jgi:hypothetical protein
MMISKKRAAGYVIVALSLSTVFFSLGFLLGLWGSQVDNLSVPAVDQEHLDTGTLPTPDPTPITPRSISDAISLPEMVVQYCVIRALNQRQLDTGEKIGDVLCFRTPEGALQYIARVTMDEAEYNLLIFGEGVSPDNVPILAIDFSRVNFGGSHLYVHANGGVCWSGGPYYLTSMPQGWDNQVESTIGYSGCNLNEVFEHTWFGQPLAQCRPSCRNVNPLGVSSQKVQR